MKLCCVVIAVVLVAGCQAHSWMSCPPSLDTRPNRGGNTVGPCEREGKTSIVTEVKAGDRLKNSLFRSRDWLSANQGPVFPDSVNSWKLPPSLVEAYANERCTKTKVGIMSKPTACYILWCPTKKCEERACTCKLQTQVRSMGPSLKCSLQGLGSKETKTSSFHQTFSWTPRNVTSSWFRHYSNFRFRAPLTLTTSSQHKVYEHFEKNVLKIVCYGHDERKGRTAYGDCVHPCNGRKGCEFMSNKYDGNRYDTTIKIPYNLKDGVYVLQYMSAMSGHKTFYYSCARIKISGGKPSLSCKRTGKAPVAFGCMAGMAIPLSKYEKNTKMGNFCFAPNGLGDQGYVTNQNSLFRSRDWLSANQRPVFPDSFGSCSMLSGRDLPPRAVMVSRIMESRWWTVGVLNVTPATRSPLSQRT
eukprot:sb/3465138/